ncbi:acyl-CoA synthetase [Spirillospora sp. NPDC049024]
MEPAAHTQGDRPLVLLPEDVPAIEAVPLAARNLPGSTYELLHRSAAAHPDRPALHLLGEDGLPWRDATSWTYETLLRRVHQAANAYLTLGLPEGGVAALMLPNLGDTYAALLGAQAVGIANPVNPMLADDHLVEILSLTGARVLLAPGPGLAPDLWAKAQRIASRLPGLRALLAVGSPPDPQRRSALEEADFDELTREQPADRLLTARRPGPRDLAAYFHTGGTTGVPKVAPHTHAMEVYMAWALGCSGAYLDDAVCLSGLPLFHVNALHVTGLGPFLHGRPVVSLGPLGYRDRTLMADFWQIIEHYRVTSFSGVPTVYASLPPIPDGVDISSLRAGAVGAAPLPGKVRTAFEGTAKVPLLEGYGLTEATCATATTPAFAPRPGSVGLRLPYQHVKAVTLDSDERPLADCPPGQTGVLAIKGPSVFPGYLRPGPDGPSPDAEGKIFDGWLLTGDLGKVDGDGYVYLTGRAKDLIIRGGHNIDPSLVEESLLAHPEVSAAAVIGAPDPHSGEVPVAYLVLAAGAQVSEEDLLAWARAHAPEPAAAPKAVHVLDALPATAVGKIYKPALLQDAVQRLVLAELSRAGLAGQVQVDLRDGRPHAHIHLATGEGRDRLASELDRHSFTHEITS